MLRLHDTPASSILTGKGGENMSTFTENYNLIKPDAEDYYDIQDANENMDAIDAQMFSLEQETEGISEKIGTADDTGTDTIFGKLTEIASSLGNSTPSIIKSIQRVTHYLPTGTQTSSCNISTVNPKKCVVIMERLKNNADQMTQINYTLSASSLSFTHSHLADSASYDYQFGFWIIEFY